MLISARSGGFQPHSSWRADRRYPLAVARYRLTIAYDGTDFVGWQKQEPPVPGSVPDESGERPRELLRSVQQTVEGAVRQVVRAPVVIIGASRTDSGVHAWHQTAAFTCPDDTPRPPDERLALAINARLPDDVLVRAAVRTRDDFDPIGDCVVKGYRYRLHVSPDRPLWDRRYVHHVWTSPDDGAMAAAAGMLVGRHDFAGFAAAGHGRESTVRTVHACSVARPTADRVDFDVSADGFLWNMVRIIAGTILDVGLGRRTIEDVRRALETGERAAAGATLPAQGLCLMWARYPEDPPKPLD